MRIRRVLAALLAVPLTGAVLGGVPAAQAAPDPNLTISQVTLDRTSVAVSGLNTYPVNVTVKGGYDSDEPGDQDLVLNVILARTGGTGPRSSIVSAALKRTGGTLENGTWTGRLNVASTANGTFKVTGVMTGPYGAPGGGTPVDPTPYSGQTIRVKGSNLPRITASVNPRVVPWGKPYSITWAVTNTATGKPYGTRIPIGLGVDTPCAEGGSPVYRTGTNGLITKSYTDADGEAMNCAHISTDPYYIVGQWLFVARPAIVSAVPSKTSVPVGTVVPVNGSVYHVTSSCPVHLQRLYGASQWRTVSSAKVRSSGRFTVNAQPSYRGLIPYRVYFPTCFNVVAGFSKTFYIRGT
ncbi:hypothetical protein [Kribbella shirazensis]|uniref:Uncharacterized protein n=1 Tax=Kribbella shirazensis TaxID=1105143 RepID=A0A7X5ZYV1_9ACTN|nr:hypothetical protein [Kribbella shirazensis]NIK55382.1 hypothetical protein [Kribbella shirazensis]